MLTVFKEEGFDMTGLRVLKRLFTGVMVLFLIYGCSSKGENRGSILIGSIRSDRKVAETKIYVYPVGNHTKEITFGYSGLDIYVPIGTYDLKIDWRGTIKWVNNVKVEPYKKAEQQVIFPLGTLVVQSSNSDGSPADASVLVTPVNEGTQGIDVQRNEKGEITAMTIQGEKIKLGDKEEEVISKFKPDFRRSEPTKEAEGTEITYYFRILGTNIDLTFTKSGSAPSTLKIISYDEKVAAGIAGEPIELNPGKYDVKVEHERITKWIRAVEIKDKEKTEQSINYPVGKIIIKPTKPIEDAKEVPVAIYLEGRYEVMAKGGKLGEEISIVPGTYDILIEYNNKKHWIRGVEVKDKGVVTKEISLTN
ncbi:MAG: hypothetical protein A2149_05195 [Candidatus Schekmanbacteria bacterium RBG_16_38_11]|uniref:Uncharacterized protein n=1 Tax=Candidatus Schekmanbacteria bacterium RBG_16_38_11 TaxID=1817880 RepID=A0A1F7RS88_9BACT|nr:MAG: hypothetical protein A2149_05195 [Candidatus Schekmanbacteria bacterium RBG_16_38_11]